LPAFEEGILVSLADKFDNLFALYSVGNFVSGSKDPFALRRQTLGIIRILIEKKLNLDIYGFLNEVFEEYKNYLSVKKEEFEEKVKSFITTRTKTVLKEYCFEYDEIEAGITTEVSNIYDAYLRIEAIHSIRQTEDFKNLAIAFKRVKNIIKNEKKVEFNESLLIENAEKELYNLYKQNREKFLACVKSQNYQQAAKILAGFRPVVDRFFDEVLVMEKDEKIKNNRVALLYVIDELFLNLIDFEKIVVE
jgi:glycyl-tRNA synthetase beta subunit